MSAVAEIRADISEEPAIVPGDRERGTHRRPPLGLLAILALAALLRMAHLGAPPTDFHVTRQYNDVLLAHSFYTDLSGSGTARDREIATLDRPPLLEPPLLESSTVGVDLLLGHETLVFPRLVSIWAWVLSGLTLWAVGRRLLGRLGASVAVGVFELLPFGVVATRGFQPDPLAVAVMLLSVLMSLRWAERPTTRRLAASALTAGAAILVKADFAPFVVCSQAAAAWMSGPTGRSRIRSMVRPAQVVWIAVALVPSVIWITVFFRSSLTLSQRIDQYFIAHYLATRAYWSNLAGQLSAVFTVPILGMAIVGLVLSRARMRMVLAASLVAYASFVVAFDYRVATHSYYQLPFVAFVALAVGCTVDACSHALTAARFRPMVPAAVGVLSILLAGVVVFHDDRLPPTAGGRVEVAAAKTVGSALCHPLHVIFVDVAYGLPLEYHGDMAGTAWPTAGDVAYYALQGQRLPPATAELSQLRSEGARYVFSTDLLTPVMPTDLRALLQPFPVVLAGPGYQVWDLDPGAPSPCQGGPG